MNKLNVEELIKAGTPRKRVLTLINHMAEVNLGGKGFLTNKEFQALVDSFKTDKEVEIYNKFRKMFDNMQIFLTNLSQFRLSYREALHRLDKFLLIKISNHDLEDLVNNLLDLMPEDKRKKAINIAEEFSNVRLLRTIIKRDSYVFVNSNIEEPIENLQKRVGFEQANLKTAIQVAKDYIQENKFTVKVFNEFIKEVEDWAKSKKDKGFSTLGLDRIIYNQGKSHQAIHKKNLLEPDYKSVPIDTKKYQYFMKGFFNA